VKKPVAYSARIAFGRGLFGHPLADLYRKVAEDRPGLGALQPFDADVADGERIEGQACLGPAQCQANHQMSCAQHVVAEVWAAAGSALPADPNARVGPD
jgi:hypothetical protein